MKINIKSKIRDYEVIFKDNSNFIQELTKINNRIFVIDKNVYSLYDSYFSEIIDEDIFLFDAVEENKTLEYAKEIFDFLLSKSAKRNITIVSVGGGITQDVSGFVASTLYRGVKWVFIPTTFLAMTDSCIGGKTSINYKMFKNLIGTFYPPNVIYIFPEFLKTLTKLDYFSGIGEVIKLQLLNEKEKLNIFKIKEKIEDLKEYKKLNEIIFENLQIKISYLEEDEFDLGKRNLLNYGHCFGHALETSSNYEVPHGIAVIIGMIFANFLASRRGLVNNSLINSINNELLLPNIPMKLKDSYFDPTILLNSMKNDKKRTGNDLTVIVPTGNDDLKFIKLSDVNEGEFYTILNETLKLLEV